MAKEILLTPSELREQARRIRDLGTSDQNLMRELTNLVIGLSFVWRAQSQETFLLEYMKMQPAVKSFHQAIEEFAKLMEEFADRMEAVDRKMAGQIGRLPYGA